MNIQYCNNCGNEGHLYRHCKLPVLSYGVLLFTNEKKLLMIRRKDSISYIEFLRGKYKLEDSEYILGLLNCCSTKEIDVISSSEGKYIGNVISDAKLFVAKFSDSLAHSGTVNITKPIIDWALSRESTLPNIMTDNDYYFVSGGDSMGHFMKGLIGFFISAGKNIISFNMEIKNIKNMGLHGKESEKDILPLMTIYNGAATRGLAIVGSEDIFLKNISIDNIISEHGNSCGLDLINECKNFKKICHIHGNTNICNVYSLGIR